jgi:N-methylhydantoinase A/oxoprolinase/acetone carboxylase beta subunit
MRRIGIDVGGTNTDAVLIEGGRIARSVKVPTTEDVTGGILAALSALAVAGPLDGVMIGTTHFINAVIRRRDLAPVAALRLGLPSGATLPPFCDWPQDLARVVQGGVWMVEGGHEFDGRPFMPLDTAAVVAAAREMRAKGLEAVAVSAVFSPVDPAHEREAARLVAAEHPRARITMSSELGRIGLLERENAALLNAALGPLAARTIAAFERALRASAIEAPLYITQNDGTVAEAAQSALRPVYGFASGATNSMRGAAFLAGLDDAMVVDVGGTSTDVGELRQGFPREANGVVEVGGVRTLFRMPDLLSVGLGGGSLVDLDPLGVGPESVGHRLTREALVFGGGRLTMTDVAVAADLVRLGDPERVRGLASAERDRVLALARTRIEETVDRMKASADPVPLIAVGGGAFLVPDSMDGIARVVRVPHGDCANAIGAAIAQVSGECDRVFRDVPRAEAIARARAEAERGAVAAGADPASLATVDVEDLPLAYLPGNALRVRVRVVGDVAGSGAAAGEGRRTRA